MPYKTDLVEANGRPAKMLLALAAAGSEGLSARDFQRLGVGLCGSKEQQMGTAESLSHRKFVERRVVLTPLGKAVVARLLSKRKAIDDSAFNEGRPHG